MENIVKTEEKLLALFNNFQETIENQSQAIDDLKNSITSEIYLQVQKSNKLVQAA
jgi:hypothetical protein